MDQTVSLIASKHLGSIVNPFTLGSGIRNSSLGIVELVESSLTWAALTFGSLEGFLLDCLASLMDLLVAAAHVESRSLVDWRRTDTEAGEELSDQVCLSLTRLSLTRS